MIILSDFTIGAPTPGLCIEALEKTEVTSFQEIHCAE